MGKRSEGIFHQRKYAESKEAHKDISKIITHQTNENQTRNEIPLGTKMTTADARKDTENLKCSHTARRNIKWHNYPGGGLSSFLKVTHNNNYF